MQAAILSTNRRSLDAILVILRFTLAIVMFPHGAQKVLGWFGGYGLNATVSAMTGMLHIPAPLVWLVLLVEFFGPILLVLGLLTRIAAIGIAIDMLVAALMVHLQFGFFVNFSGQQKGEGIEFHLLMIGIAVVLAIAGAGRYSIDASLADSRAAAK